MAFYAFYVIWDLVMCYHSTVLGSQGGFRGSAILILYAVFVFLPIILLIGDEPYYCRPLSTLHANLICFFPRFSILLCSAYTENARF